MEETLADEDVDDAGEAEAVADPDPAPSTETAGEEDVEITETEAESPWKRTRDDIYRRTSRIESRIDQTQQSIDELKNLMLRGGASLGGTKGSDGSSTTLDPMQARLRLNQDPVGFLRSVVREELQQTETRVSGTIEERQAEADAQRVIDREYPEASDPDHPFFPAADKIYRELRGRGFPDNRRTILTAVEMAAAKHPELREQSLKERRRAGGREATRTGLSDSMKVEKGVPKPKQKEGGLPPLTQEQEALATKWKINLKDPKVRERIQRTNAELTSMRLPTRSEMVQKGEEE